MRLLSVLVFLLFSLQAQASSKSKSYDAKAPELKTSDLAIVQRAEELRSTMYPEWSGNFSVVPFGMNLPRVKTSGFSNPGVLGLVRKQMLRAASLEGEESFVQVLTEDPRRWNSIIASADQLASDTHTAFVSPSHGKKLNKAVGLKFIDTLDPSRIIFSADDVAMYLHDKAGLSSAISGEDLGWIDRVASEARRRQTELVEDSIDRFKNAGGLAELPSYCAGAKPWVIKERRFLDKKELAGRRLSGLCDTLVTRYLRVKDGETSTSEVVKLQQEYEKLLAQLKSPLRGEAYASFVQARMGVLDPHSTYIPPASKTDFSAIMAAAYVGLGLNVSFASGFPVFSRVNENGPAYDAGIRQGDQLLAIGLSQEKMLPVLDLSANQVLNMMSGVEGGSVWMRIKDGTGVEVDKAVRRRRIEVASGRVQVDRIESKTTGSAIVHIQVGSFYKDPENPDRPGGSTTSDIRHALEQARDGDWVLLDLRGNGGGLLDEALGVSGLFLPEGLAAVQVQQPSGEVMALDVRKGQSWKGKLAVLVDRSTGSASEIVAAALQDYGRALILGERTYGKGTAQSLFDLDAWAGAPAPVYGQINLTAMRFFRPSGLITQRVGVVPDIAFLPEEGEGREVSLDGAMSEASIPAVPDVAAMGSKFPFSCLTGPRQYAKDTWNYGPWSAPWRESLAEVHARSINLVERKRLIDGKMAIREQLKVALSTLPDQDAPLFVVTNTLNILTSCFSSFGE